LNSSMVSTKARLPDQAQINYQSRFTVKANMKLSKIIANIAYVVVLVASINAPARADNYAAAPTRTQIAYLTPMADLQHSRDDASAAYQSTQFAAALSHYQNICQSTASNAKDYYWLGETYFHLNRYGEAAQSFEKTVAMEPRMDSVQVRIVQAYIFAKQPEVARQKCLAAMSLVTDPIVRQQLNVLEQSCSSTPHPTRVITQKRSTRVGE